MLSSFIDPNGAEAKDGSPGGDKVGTLKSH
jgi:hypothetical protein